MNNFFSKFIFLILLIFSTKNINCMQMTYINIQGLFDIIIELTEENYPSLIINKNTIWNKVLRFASTIKENDNESLISPENIIQDKFISLSDNRTKKFINIIINDDYDTESSFENYFILDGNYSQLSKEERRMSKMGRSSSPRPKRKNKIIRKEIRKWR